ncbi:hypothetical protein BKH43_01025 [Helicobacter sp. 13S00401-1]|uniref:conjugal transfer protein TraF n=1 Tax=Helicobacter sp. 13S00401-1 TaxID=1905758 RepID=UPI000BA4FD8C|nr:conjugal transfer protein TraF [Helicobacter sp. 13S00401-1]PAF51846.1 hypothetical protein BKH43_01025 [Helicobacter sp. 13S00401-1]
MKDFIRFNKNILKTAGVIALLGSSAQALEFGSMGNLSASMGGAGVALRSPFGLYYNPALIASGNKTRLGYSFGTSIREHNVDRLLPVLSNLENMANTFSNLSSSLAGSSNGLSTLTSAATSSSGAAVATTAVLAAAATNSAAGSTNSTTDATNGTPDNLKDIIKEALKKADSTNSTVGTATTSTENLQKLFESYKSANGGDFDKLVKEVAAAAKKADIPQDQKDLITKVAEGVDWNHVKFDDNGISSIAIKKGQSPELDKAMKDINTILDVFKSNNINFRSQNGIALQLTSPYLKSVIGAIAIGVFNDTHGNLNLQSDPSKLRLIVGSGDSYSELSTSPTGYTFSKSDKSSYDNHSLLASLQNGDSKVVTSLFILTEVPVGYAYSIELPGSNLNVGVALKYMRAYSMYQENEFSDFGSGFASFQNDIRNMQVANSFGVDVGVDYDLNLFGDSALSIGAVAKNVNTPTFNFTNATVKIKPQYRAGIAYNGDFFSAAFDADLLPNEVYPYVAQNSANRLLSQMVGGGARVGFKYVDIRAGVAYDLKQDSGVILTAGLNLFGFLDISAQVGTKTFEYQGYTIPKYADIKIGGSFSW